MVETRVSGVMADKVIRSISFTFSHRVEARRFLGGIWVSWKSSVEVVVDFNHFQFIHLRVKFPSTQEWILFTGVYGSTCSTIRKDLWTELGAIA